MAERSHWWTERCLRSPFFRSLSLTIYLPTYLFSMYLSIYRSIYLSLSFFHSITQSIYLSISKSGPSMVCFVHFDLEMCFAPQRRAIFSSLIRPAGSAPAALASLLFDPPEPQIIGKTQWIATFLTFRASASSSDSFSSDLLSSNLSLLSASSLLCFSSVHIVGSLTSKLPSMTDLIKIRSWIQNKWRIIF